MATDAQNSTKPAAAGNHFVAAASATPLQEIDAFDESAPSASFWREAWHKLRFQPIFIISSVLIIIILIVAIFPGLFTKINPAITTNTHNCLIQDAFGKPSKGHILGFDNQGCDMFSLVIYGTRPSLLVGLFTTIGSVILGGGLGVLAGYYGRALDAILSRVTDIFFAIPLILAAMVLLQGSAGKGVGILGVVVVLAVFGWPQLFRITRGAVIQVRNNDFITASKALGVSRFRILLRHIIPNVLSPVIVMSTVNLGTFIVAEATLSFLGLGLSLSQHSWGMQLSSYQEYFQQDPSLLLYPSAALAITVLAFIMLGDALRDALDPKAKR